MTGSQKLPGKSKTLLKALLALLSVLVVLLCCEFAIRLLFPVAGQLYTSHSERHYAFAPGAKKMHLRHPENGAGRFMIEINANGFRGDDFPLQPIQETGEGKRLAVYGDSFVAGEYSALEATLCRQLEARIGKPWSVINAGVTGYGLDQTLLKMESELDTLRPDALALVICSENDSIDLMRNKLFEVADDGSLRATGAQLSQDMQAALSPHFFLNPRNSLLAKTAIRALRGLRHKASSASDDETPESVCADFLARCQAQYDEFQVQRDLEVTQVIEDFYDIDWSLNPDSEVSRFKRAVTHGILKRIQNNASRRGIPLTIVIVPSIRDVVQNDDIFARGLQSMPGYEPTSLTGHYQAIASSLSIRCLNLYQPFVYHGAESLFFKAHDSHWNDAGQEFAAGLIHSFLTEEGGLSTPVNEIATTSIGIP